ncbi:MAG: DUF4190 domain-containing protein [Pseudomonadota bacterium]|jgi:hypothetical protein|nr:DUF4190 domain-containing protein [Pseudomonadota bacterium]
MSEQPSSRSAPATSSLAVVSLVFGILAWCALPFVGAIVAVICGHLARSEIRHAHADNRLEGDGMAVAGLLLGYAQLVLWVLLVFVVVAALAFGVAFSHWF